MEQKVKRSISPVFLLKILLFSYVLTVLFLLILAMLLFKMSLGESFVNVGIVVIYIAACLAAGFITGKKAGNRKFLWGMLAGFLYFLILALLSVILGGGTDGLSNHFVSTLFLCTGSGMLGGMLA